MQVPKKHSVSFSDSLSEKKSTNPVFAQHAPKFLDGEEGDQGHKNDQRASEQFVTPLFQKGHEAPCQGISLPKPLDCVFDKVKYDDKESKYDSFVQGGDDQRLLL